MDTVTTVVQIVGSLLQLALLGAVVVFTYRVCRK